MIHNRRPFSVSGSPALASGQLGCSWHSTAWERSWTRMILGRGLRDCSAFSGPWLPLVTSGMPSPLAYSQPSWSLPDRSIRSVAAPAARCWVWVTAANVLSQMNP